MDKEKIIRKLKMKDYNEKLEEILANKTFSKDAKNLLSSMLYKVENSYEDYKKTKVEVPSKNEFLEELITIIGNDCKEIEIAKINSEENSIPQGKKSITIKEEQKIVTYQNELALLKAIYELNTNKFNKETDELAEKLVLLALSDGEQTSKAEIIRDFDGWSWNVMTSEIENYIPNLIYQAIVYLLGYNTLNQNKNIGLKDLEMLLKEKYKTPLVEKIIKSATSVSISNYIKSNAEEKRALRKIKRDLQKRLKLMEDKKTYIEEITNQKKKYVKEIEKIDKYINDDIELKTEYIRQNERLPQDQRVFSLSDFSEKIEARRDFLENEIKSLTEKLKPQNFVKEKEKVEKKLNLIKEISEENIEKITKEYIELVLKAINSQIEKLETKKEIIDKIYVLRYLKLINVDEEIKAGDLCAKQFENVEKRLITTGCNLKVLNIFSHDIAENYKIYKNIFNTKIIDLDSAYIEISKENFVRIYDENSLEKEEKNSKFKELIVRYNKKTKLFI